MIITNMMSESVNTDITALKTNTEIGVERNEFQDEEFRLIRRTKCNTSHLSPSSALNLLHIPGSNELHNARKNPFPIKVRIEHYANKTFLQSPIEKDFLSPILPKHLIAIPYHF